jgi:hypothetical protein
VLEFHPRHQVRQLHSVFPASFLPRTKKAHCLGMSPYICSDRATHDVVAALAGLESSLRFSQKKASTSSRGHGLDLAVGTVNTHSPIWYFCRSKELSPAALQTIRHGVDNGLPANLPGQLFHARD